jgi:hypothetical protein
MVLQTVLTTSIYAASMFLFLSSGANEGKHQAAQHASSKQTLVSLVATSLSLLHGTQTVPWKGIFCAMAASAIGSFFSFSRYETAALTAGSWLDIFGTVLDASSNAQMQLALGGAFSAALLAAATGLWLSLPLALGPLFCSALAGFLVGSPIRDGVDWASATWNMAEAYVLMPLLAAFSSWLLFRLFIRRAVLDGDETRFNRTLSWTVVTYPLAVALSVATLLPRILPHRLSLSTALPEVQFNVTLLTLALSAASFIVSYVAMRLFFKAWLKHRTFTLYPQECAQYLKLAERPSEPADREARGLGPGSSGLRPSTSTGSTAAILAGRPASQHPRQSSIGSASHVASAHQLHPLSLALSSSQGHVHPTLTADGQIALNIKRSEELFRPIVFVFGLFFTLSIFSFEGLQLTVLLNRLPRVVVTWPWWLGWAMLVLGRLTAARHISEFVGSRIFVHIRPSHAYAVYFGVMVALLIGSVKRTTLIASPLMCVVASLVAVGIAGICSKNDPGNLPITPTDPSHQSHYFFSSEALPGQVRSSRFRTFRNSICKLFLFWILSSLCAFLIGFTVGKSAS